MVRRSEELGTAPLGSGPDSNRPEEGNFFSAGNHDFNVGSAKLILPVGRDGYDAHAGKREARPPDELLAAFRTRSISPEDEVLLWEAAFGPPDDEERPRPPKRA